MDDNYQRMSNAHYLKVEHCCGGFLWTAYFAIPNWTFRIFLKMKVTYFLDIWKVPPQRSFGEGAVKFEFWSIARSFFEPISAEKLPHLRLPGMRGHRGTWIHLCPRRRFANVHPKTFILNCSHGRSSEVISRDMPNRSVGSDQSNFSLGHVVVGRSSVLNISK